MNIYIKVLIKRLENRERLKDYFIVVFDYKMYSLTLENLLI